MEAEESVEQRAHNEIEHTQFAAYQVIEITTVSLNNGKLQMKETLECLVNNSGFVTLGHVASIIIFSKLRHRNGGYDRHEVGSFMDRMSYTEYKYKQKIQNFSKMATVFWPRKNQEDNIKKNVRKMTYVVRIKSE